MIPIHNSEKTTKKEIIINRLSTLNEYDFSEPHRHNYFEFFFFAHGGGSHIIDFHEFAIESNSIHIVAPGQVHQVNRALDSMGYVYLFELDALSAPAEISDFLFDHGCYDVDEMNPTYHFEKKDSTLIELIVDAIWEAYQRKDNLAQISIRNAIQSLCIQCMSKVKLNNSIRTESEYGAFRKLLFTNFREMKKVKEYAEALNISDKALNEIVKKQTGQSASQIIYNQIILEAKRLLLTGISTKETAYQLNFDDPAHFSKFFKSNMGRSPSEFQKLHD